MNDGFLRFASGLPLLWLLAISMAQAQITPDNTLPETSQVTPGCTTCLINGGTTQGVNLFHSFSEFSIPTGGTAWFNNAPAIENILTRVTGNSISNIDGLLRTNGHANLFLLNPNGIIFGPNAQLQIGGSFFASTANRFKFSDGSEFSATNPQAPPLLTVSLQPGLQTGTVQPGSTIANYGNLNAGEDLILVGDRLELQGQLQSGRDLTLQGQNTVQIRDTTTHPFVAAAGRDLLVQGDRTVDINALTHTNSELIAGRDLVLRSGQTIGGDAHYRAGGNVQIENLTGGLGDLSSPYDPIIRARGDVRFNNYTGASLHILAGGSVFVPGLIDITGVDFNQSLTETVTLSDGRTIVNINGRNLPTLDIRAGTTAIGTPLGLTGRGNFGGGVPVLSANPTSANIQIGTIYTPVDVEGLVLLTNQYRANPALNGNIQVGTIDTSIPSSSLSLANGGPVFIDSRGDITLTGRLDTSATFGSAGNVRLIAQGNVNLLQGSTVSASQYDAFGFGLGRAGSIAIDAANINLTGSQILSITVGLQAGGNLTLNTRDTGSVNLRNSSFVTTLTVGDGRGGDVTVNTGRLLVEDSLLSTATVDGQDLGVNVLPGARGQAGNLTIFARDNITLINTQPDNAFNTTIVTPLDAFPISVPTGLNSRTQSQGNAGNLQLTTDRLVIRGGATATTSTNDQGQAGNLTVNALQSVELLGVSDSGLPSALFSQSEGERTRQRVSGSAGNIQITTGRLVIRDGATASTSVREDSQGNGGNLTVRADSVELSGTSPNGLSRSSLLTATLSTGNAGNLQIDTQRLYLDRGAIISSSTLDQGNGGRLTVNASESVDVIGSAFDNLPTILATGTGGSGNSETLTINTRRLNVRDGALVSAATYEQGRGGNLIIHASESVELAGRASDGRASSVSAGSGLQGYAQAVNGLLEIFGFSKRIDPAQARGPGGTLQLVTGQLTLHNGAMLSTETTGTGAGGNMQIQANTLNAFAGGQISAKTSGSGQAGNMIINVSDQLTLTGNGTGLFASTTAGSTGNGGSITIDPRVVLIQDGARIAVDSQGSGTGGNIFLQAGRLELRDRASITAETASAQGGNITLDVGNLLLMRRNSLISATAGTAQARGDGGNITINIPSGFIIGVLSENSDIRANAFTGRGGNVNITAQGIYGLQFQEQDTPFSDITASSQFGVSGVVTLNTPNVDPSRGLVALPFNLVDPSRQIAQSCTPHNQPSGSFTVTGRGGLPLSPDEPLASRPATGQWISLEGRNSEQNQSAAPTAKPTSAPNAASTPTIAPPVEAQNVAISADGTVQLVAPVANPPATWQTTVHCP